MLGVVFLMINHANRSEQFAIILCSEAQVKMNNFATDAQIAIPMQSHQHTVIVAAAVEIIVTRWVLAHSQVDPEKFT